MKNLIKNFLIAFFFLTLFFLSCTNNRYEDAGKNTNEQQMEKYAEREHRVSLSVWYMYDEEMKVHCYFSRYGGMYCFK